MSSIKDIFKEKKLTFSIELFPPKTDKGYANLLNTIKEMTALKPDFFSCTYGAGGGSRDKTLDIVEHIEKTHNIPAMHHLTCVMHTKDELKKIIHDIKSRGVENILALRGDPPRDNPDWIPKENNFQYSNELVSFIREELGADFSISVAGFPEGHLLCPDLDQDAQYLKQKVQSGADFVITQLFFDNRDYFEYMGRLKNIDVETRIIPGIIPITDYQGLLRFTAMCGASVPENVKEIFAPIADDKEATLKAGIDYAIEQCQRLLAAGAPGIHFYALNKVHPIDDILKAIR
jgi:methylenetetrahydrofolate reductase (NADPH)